MNTKTPAAQSSVTEPAAPLALPRILVLMATYNGERFLQEQLQSLALQDGVAVTVLVSDDCSQDGTLALIEGAARTGLLDIRVVSSGVRHGGACRNFLHLIGLADASGYDAVALCDQDDVWLPAKLQRAAAQLAGCDADGYSSNSIPFWNDGREHFVRKNYPQAEFDYLFESASHGCTYVVSARLFGAFQQWLCHAPPAVASLDYHDWLLYAWARRNGWRWVMDSQAQIRYRQSEHNVIGANVGGSAIRARLGQLSAGWLRKQAILMAEVLGMTDLSHYHQLVRFSVSDRLQLAVNATRFRRRKLHQLVFAAAVLTIGI